tara:strand:+ start:792 stop:2126 length:1335 start_codon:yes stop_codon:yes gene_type:complete
MYSPQQLFQFITYAKNYLELQDVEFKSSDVLLDPNKEEDVNKLIAIALAEHRDGDVPSGFATNNFGDQGRSRGPWQIYGSTWESVLRQYSVFENVEDINDALDDPGMNAIAAVIIAQYDVGERKGIDNWSTVINDPFEIKANTGEFIEAAKQYDTNLIENPVQEQDAEGNITDIPAEPTLLSNRNPVTTNVMEEESMSIANMASDLKRAKRGSLFKNNEEVVTYSGNRVRRMSGQQINNEHKNLLADVNIADLSNQEIVDFYSKNVHPYLSYNSSFRGVDMQGDGQNIVDLLQNKKFSNKDNFYVPGENKVITGEQVNQRVNAVKSYMYQYFLNKKQEEPLEQLDSVYEYIFRTAFPYIKVEDDVEDAVGSTPQKEMRQEFQEMRQAFPGTELPTPQAMPQNNSTEAAPGFLNNLEKILRVKPQGSKVRKTEESVNQARDFLNR